MDDKKLIDDLVKMLDSGMEKGVGHVNIEVDKNTPSTPDKASMDVQTLGCSDCSRTPLACSVPTLQEGLDDYK